MPITLSCPNQRETAGIPLRRPSSRIGDRNGGLPFTHGTYPARSMCSPGSGDSANQQRSRPGCMMMGVRRWISAGVPMRSRSRINVRTVWGFIGPVLSQSCRAVMLTSFASAHHALLVGEGRSLEFYRRPLGTVGRNTRDRRCDQQVRHNSHPMAECACAHIRVGQCGTRLSRTSGPMGSIASKRQRCAPAMLSTPTSSTAVIGPPSRMGAT